MSNRSVFPLAIDSIAWHARGFACLALLFGVFGPAVAQTLPAGSQGALKQATPPPKVTTPDVKIPGELSLPGSNPSELGAQPLTLDEAVSIALKKQPNVNIAWANFVSQQGRVQQVAAALNPQFSAAAGYNNQSSIRSSAAILTPYSASVSVQQLIFDFGKTRDAVRQQQALERSTRFTVTRTQQSTALQVRTAFYNLVQNLANVKVSELDVATRQRELDEATARMNNGLGAPGDVIQAKSNLADGAIGLAAARNSALDSEVTLAQLMGINPRTPIVPASAAEPIMSDESNIEKLVADAVKDRPDIGAAKEQVKAAVFGVSMAQKGNLPRLDGVVGMTGKGPNDPTYSEAGIYGITVTWLFGDGGLTAGQVKEARGAEESARQSLISVTNQAISDVSQAFVDLQAALQRLDLAQVDVANSQELVRIDEGRYVGGIGQFLDVTTAQSALVAAQRNLTQAQGDVQRARANLRVATGQM